MGFINPYNALRFSLIVMGFTATAAQIVIIRELLITFQGNELFLGIIFGNWLILEAVGSLFARKRADITQRYTNWFVIIQILIGFSAVLSIFFIRSFKYFLNIPVGEVLGIHYVVIVSLIALAPVSMLDGSLFPLGCRNLSSLSKKEEAAAKAYLYESAGSFVAGLTFVVYLIYYLDAISLAFIILGLNLCSAIIYLTFLRRLKWLRNTAGLVLLISILFSFLSGTKWLHLVSSNLLWYEYPLLDTRNSVYANFAVIKGEDQYTFFSNGSPYATTPSPEIQVEETAHFPMLFHGDPQEVLIVGGGAGGLLRELLKYPVKKIDYAEHDPLVIETFRRFPTPLTEYELGNERVALHLLEGRLYLKKTPALYDLILINMPLPSTLLLNRYYTVEFFEIARRHLKDGGIFSLKLPGSETFLSEELRELNRTVYVSLKKVFPYIRLIVGEQNIFVASMDEKTEILDHNVLTERLSKQKIEANLVSKQYIRYKMNKSRFGGLENEITSFNQKPLNYDYIPRGLFEGMLFLNRIVSPFMVDILNFIEDIPFHYYLVSGAFLTIILLTVEVLRKNHLFLRYAIASTGFTSMLMSILLIILFQIYYGHIYHYIGVLTSLFMLGSAIGAFLAMKRVNTRLIFPEFMMLSLLCLAYIFVALKPLPGISQAMIFFLMFSAGLLTGAEFPIAVNSADRLYRAVGKTAGNFYALDLCGAFIGAIITAVVFIPIAGIERTIILSMAIKASSVIITFVGSSRKQQPG